MMNCTHATSPIELRSDVVLTYPSKIADAERTTQCFAFYLRVQEHSDAAAAAAAAASAVAEGILIMLSVCSAAMESDKSFHRHSAYFVLFNFKSVLQMRNLQPNPFPGKQEDSSTQENKGTTTGTKQREEEKGPFLLLPFPATPQHAYTCTANRPQLCLCCTETNTSFLRQSFGFLTSYCGLLPPLLQHVEKTTATRRTGEDENLLQFHL